jgi:hypothetical protein
MFFLNPYYPNNKNVFTIFKKLMRLGSFSDRRKISARAVTAHITPSKKIFPCFFYYFLFQCLKEGTVSYFGVKIHL